MMTEVSTTTSTCALRLQAATIVQVTYRGRTIPATGPSIHGEQKKRLTHQSSIASLPKRD
jgi:hypothetical protein